MYKKILVPLDGSPLAEAVLPSVKEMAQGMGAEVVLFQAVSPNLDRVAAPDEYMSVVYVEQGLERAQLEAEVYLRKVARDLRAEGIRVQVAIGAGEPAEEILSVAEKIDADLIAMATHGRSGLVRLIYGSVAGNVLRNADRPVVLVKPDSKVAQAA